MTMDPNQPRSIEIEDLPELEAEEAVIAAAEARVTQLAQVTGRGGAPLMRWLGRALAVLVTVLAGIYVWSLVGWLLSLSPVLAWGVAALVALVVALLLAVALREWAAIARLGRIEHLRTAATEAHAGADADAARRVTADLVGLYAGRGDAAWGISRFRERQEDLFDAAAILDAAERDVLAPLDAAAQAEIEASAARVATITALVPLALVDVAAALVTNLTMIQRLTQIYGGRAGTIGAWRLTRAVIGHLAATGLLAMGDDLLGSTIGGGLVAKLSRRFGEGLINGALTVRVGLVAMRLCRPMEFRAVARPAPATVIRRALAGLVQGAGK